MLKMLLIATLCVSVMLLTLYLVLSGAVDFVVEMRGMLW